MRERGAQEQATRHREEWMARKHDPRLNAKKKQRSGDGRWELWCRTREEWMQQEQQEQQETQRDRRARRDRICRTARSGRRPRTPMQVAAAVNQRVKIAAEMRAKSQQAERKLQPLLGVMSMTG
jgi:hypothetical protein